MKKSRFVALVMGTVSGILFAVGMCMALLPEWDALKPGIVLGCAGIVLGIITVMVWRKMEHKSPIRITGKHALAIVVGILGSLLLGVGMCLCMVWKNLIVGIIVGVIGIISLLCLVPILGGLKD